MICASDKKTDLKKRFDLFKDKFSSATKQITLPLFDGQNLYDVFTFLFKEFRRDSINVRAASVAFSFMLALFPSVLVVFTLIPYIPVPSFRETVLQTLQGILPSNAYKTVSSTVIDIVENHHGKILSIGIVLSFYYMSRGVVGLINSFDKVYPAFRQRSFWMKTAVSIKITFLLFILLLLSMFLIVEGEFFMKYLMQLIGVQGGSAYLFLSSVKWLIIILLFYFSISLIYFYGPALHTRFRFFSAGSSIATFLSILTSLGFSYFINHFSTYNKVYGSIGTLIVLMLWLYYNSLVLLIGFELNASISINKSIKSNSSLESNSI